MNTRPLICTMALAMASIATPAIAGGDHHKPRHGGILTSTPRMDFELVAQPQSIQLYLSDHGKPVDVSQASGKLTLLTGAEKQEVTLQPARDKLEATGSFKLSPGTKAVAVVTAADKPMTVRFVINSL